MYLSQCHRIASSKRQAEPRTYRLQCSSSSDRYQLPSPNAQQFINNRTNGKEIKIYISYYCMPMFIGNNISESWNYQLFEEDRLQCQWLLEMCLSIDTFRFCTLLPKQSHIRQPERRRRRRQPQVSSASIARRRRRHSK